MKKTSRLFMAGLITLCFSLSTAAQSSQQDLDQVELMKKLAGTWIAETGKDSITIWEVVAFEKGYITTTHYKAKGQTYSTVKGIMGFNGNYRHLVLCQVWSNGYIGVDVGGFVSDTKLAMERYTPASKHVTMSYEADFITPNKFKAIIKWRGMKDTWDDAKVFEEIYNRTEK